MPAGIVTAHGKYGLRSGTASAYRAYHEQVLAKKRARGLRVSSQIIEEPVIAYVSDNRWVTLCACGCGCMTGPDVGIACCWECGSVYVRVVFPENADEIEAVLAERPQPRTRNWAPGESAGDLAADNVAHGVGRVR